jgi:flagellar basal-body rod protein FlgG
MQSGYYSSAAGMVTQFNRLDVIANNLANVNTIGYKEDNVVVGDFMRVLQEARDELPNENNTKEAAKFINRTITKAPQVVDEYTDHSLGNMEKTDNPLDFSLTKKGLFFLVETPDGVKLTRDGSFSLDDDGYMVTKSGYKVLPSDYFDKKEGIQISANDSILEVDKNGQLYRDVPGTKQMTKGSKFFIVQPDNLAMLKKEGDNLYKYEPDTQFKSVDESGAVKQGFVERSNVNAVKMMTDMIETNRLVGMYQKAMQVQMDDMNNDAINKLASAK